MLVTLKAHSLKKSINYVSTGKAEGAKRIVIALADALDKLPIKIDKISKLLFNLWTPKDEPLSLSEISSLPNFLCGFSADIYISWGIAVDESME